MDERIVGAAYFAVIPGPVLDDRCLSESAKLLYGRITSLADREGYCWATNEYLSQLTGYGVRTITRLVALLAQRGHVEVEVVPAAKKGGRERRIYIGRQAARGLAKNGHGSQNCLDGLAKNGQTLLNSMINKKDNNPLYPPKDVLNAIDSYIGDDPEYRAAFDGFLVNRKALKKPVLTARAINAIINRLRRVCQRETEIAMLDKATENNWLTVYPLKPDELPSGAGVSTQGDEEGIDGL